MRMLQTVLFMMSLFGVHAYDPYPYNPIIHNLGNHGIMGRIHAELAPLFTHFTEQMVYGTDLRKQVVQREARCKRVLDLGCGVGYSTSVAEGSIGLDTSAEMIAKGRQLFPEKEFVVGHSEHWIPDRDFDVVTCFFMFHETPRLARQTIIERCKTIANEKVIIVDISPDYFPSHAMLNGEPYLLGYLKEIETDLADFQEHILVPNHVHMWTYEVTSLTDRCCLQI